MARTLKSPVWGNVAYSVLTEHLMEASSWAGAGCSLYAYAWSYGVTGCKHPGMDISMPQGTNLYAIAGGVVKRIRNQDISGRMEVVIGDSKGHEHLYTHMSTRNVSTGQTVKAGQLLGKSGTMNSPHLHFEHRVPNSKTSSGWSFVNPEPLLTSAAPAGGGGTSAGSTVNLSAISTDFRLIGDVHPDVYESEFKRVGSPLVGQGAALQAAASPMSALFLAQMWMENKYSTTGFIIKPADNNPVAMRPWEADPRRTVSRTVIDWSTRASVGSMTLPTHYAGAIRDSTGKYFARFTTVAGAAQEYKHRLAANSPYKGGVYNSAKTLKQMLNIWAPSGDIHPVTGVANENSGYYTTVVSMLQKYAAMSEGKPSIPVPGGTSTGNGKFILSMGHRNTDRGGATKEIDWTPGATRALRDAIKARGGQAWILQEEDGLDKDPNWFPGGLQAGARKCVDLASKYGPFNAYISMHYNSGASPGAFAIFPESHDSSDTKNYNAASVNLARELAAAIKKTNTVSLISWTRDRPGVMSEKETGVGAQGYRLGEMVGTMGFRDRTQRIILEAGSYDVARERAYIQDPQWVRHVYCEAIVDALEKVYGKFRTDADTTPDVPLPTVPKPTPPATGTATPQAPAADPGPDTTDTGPVGKLLMPLDGLEKVDRDTTDFMATVQEPQEWVGGPYEGGSWASRVEVASTNYVTNPYAGADLVGIGSGNVNVALDRVPLQYLPLPRGGVATTVVRSVSSAPGIASVAYWDTAGFPAAVNAPISGRVVIRGWGPTIGKRYRAALYEGGGAVTARFLYGSWVTLDGSVQELTVSGTLNAADRTVIRIYVYEETATAGVGRVVDLTSAQVENLPYVTSAIPKLEPDTPNLLKNPTFDQIATNASVGWDNTLNGTTVPATGTWGNGYNSGVTNPTVGYHAHISPDGGPDGSPCLEFIDRNEQFGMPNRWQGISQVVDDLAKLLVVGAQLTVSMDIYVSDVGKPVDVGVYYRVAGVTSFHAGRKLIYAEEANRWERVETTWTIETAADAGSVASIYVYGNSGGIEADLKVDNVQLEEGDTQTVFWDHPAGAGLPMPGHAWTGVAHASRSTRALGRLYIPHTATIASHSRGSLLMRVQTTGLKTTPVDRWFMVLGHSGTNQIMLRVNTSDKRLYALGRNSSGTEISASVALPVTMPEWITLYIGWETGQKLQVAIDGGTAAVSTANWAPTQSGWSTQHGLSIGSGYNGGEPFGYGTDQLIIFDRRLDTAQRQLVSDTPFWWLTMLSTEGTQYPDEDPTGAVVPVDPDQAPYEPTTPPVYADAAAPFHIEGRQYATSVALYRGTIRGEIIESLALDYDGTMVIAHSDDAPIHRTLDLPVSDVLDLVDHRGLEPYVDTVIPVMTQTDDRGETRREMLGCYVLEPWAGTDTPTMTTTTLRANDLTWLLARTPVLDGWTAPGGQEIGSIVSQKLRELGFAPSQISIGNTGKQTPPEGIPYWPGQTWQGVLDNLLNRAQWYRLAMTRRGVLTSKPWNSDLSYVAPVIHYDTRRGHWISETLTRNPDWGRFGNIAIARRIPTSKNEPYIGYTAVNDNPQSPVSTVHRGPVLIQPIIEGEFETEAEAKAAATMQLSRGMSFFNRITITTGAEMTAEAYELVSIDIERVGVPLVTGRWNRQSWSLTWDGVTALTAHNLNRVEAFE